MKIKQHRGQTVANNVNFHLNTMGLNTTDVRRKIALVILGAQLRHNTPMIAMGIVTVLEVGVTFIININ